MTETKIHIGPGGPIWGLVGPFISSGPVGPMYFFGLYCPIHLFWALLGPFICLGPVGTIHSCEFEFMAGVSPLTWQKEAQCTLIVPIADRPELPYEVHVFNLRFPTKPIFSEAVSFL